MEFRSEIYPDCYEAKLDPVLLVMSTWSFTKQSYLSVSKSATPSDIISETEMWTPSHLL